MSAPNRFQVHRARSEQGDVVTSVGVDPLTGLPVLVYTFPGRPTAGEGVLESENIPGILSSSFDGARGRVVTAYSRDYRPLAPGEAALTAAVVVEAARALRDAAAAGVVHGDLRPGRILHADGHVLIEGYGVPWRARGRDFAPPEYDGEGSYAGDVYSFAQALLHLGRSVLPGEMLAALGKAQLPNPEARPSAEELHELLARARDADEGAAAAAPGPEAAFDAITLAPAASGARTGPDLELELDVDLEPLVPAADARPSPPPPAPPPEATPPAPPARRPAVAPPPAPSDPAPADPDPIDIATDPDPDRMRLRRSTDHEGRRGFVKELPPGATYRSGDVSGAAPPGAFTFDDDPIESGGRRRLGRLFLLGLTIAAAVAAAALLLPRQQGFVGPSQQTIYYTVNIAVDPPSVPRMDLVTVRSPEGSSFGPGDILDTVPGQVLLDAEGRWVLQGRFQGRLTEPVELAVPSQRSATLVLAEPEEAAPAAP